MKLREVQLAVVLYDEERGQKPRGCVGFLMVLVWARGKALVLRFVFLAWCVELRLPPRRRRGTSQRR